MFGFSKKKSLSDTLTPSINKQSFNWSQGQFGNYPQQTPPQPTTQVKQEPLAPTIQPAAQSQPQIVPIQTAQPALQSTQPVSQPAPVMHPNTPPAQTINNAQTSIAQGIQLPTTPSPNQTPTNNSTIQSVQPLTITTEQIRTNQVPVQVASATTPLQTSDNRSVQQSNSTLPAPKTIKVNSRILVSILAFFAKLPQNILIAIKSVVAFFKLNRKNIYKLFGILGILIIVTLVLKWILEPTQAPSRVTISNKTESSFTVSWITYGQETKGEVYIYGDEEKWIPVISSITAKSFDDARDVVNKSNIFTKLLGYEKRHSTHYINVTGLDPETRYNIKIKVGNKLYTKDDIGQDISWVWTYAQIDKSSNPNPSYGKVLSQNSYPIDDAIVYTKLQTNDGTQSNLLSSITNESGNYTYDSTNARTKDGSSLFTHNDVDEVVMIEGGDMGRTLQAADKTNNNPVDDAVMTTFTDSLTYSKSLSEHIELLEASLYSNLVSPSKTYASDDTVLENSLDYFSVDVFCFAIGILLIFVSLFLLNFKKVISKSKYFIAAFIIIEILFSNGGLTLLSYIHPEPVYAYTSHSGACTGNEWTSCHMEGNNCECPSSTPTSTTTAVPTTTSTPVSTTSAPQATTTAPTATPAPTPTPTQAPTEDQSETDYTCQDQCVTASLCNAENGGEQIARTCSNTSKVCCRFSETTPTATATTATTTSAPTSAPTVACNTSQGCWYENNNTVCRCPDGSTTTTTPTPTISCNTSQGCWYENNNTVCRCPDGSTTTPTVLCTSGQTKQEYVQGEGVCNYSCSSGTWLKGSCTGVTSTPTVSCNTSQGCWYENNNQLCRCPDGSTTTPTPTPTPDSTCDGTCLSSATCNSNGIAINGSCTGSLVCCNTQVVCSTEAKSRGCWEMGNICRCPDGSTTTPTPTTTTECNIGDRKTLYIPGKGVCTYICTKEVETPSWQQQGACTLNSTPIPTTPKPGMPVNAEQCDGLPDSVYEVCISSLTTCNSRFPSFYKTDLSIGGQSKVYDCIEATGGYCCGSKVQENELRCVSTSGDAGVKSDVVIACTNENDRAIQYAIMAGLSLDQDNDGTTGANGDCDDTDPSVISEIQCQTRDRSAFCEHNSECPKGSVCDTNFGRCTVGNQSGEGGKCQNTLNCVDGYLCTDGKCVTKPTALARLLDENTGKTYETCVANCKQTNVAASANYGNLAGGKQTVTSNNVDYVCQDLCGSVVAYATYNETALTRCPNGKDPEDCNQNGIKDSIELTLGYNIDETDSIINDYYECLNQGGMGGCNRQKPLILTLQELAKKEGIDLNICAEPDKLTGATLASCLMIADANRTSISGLDSKSLNNIGIGALEFLPAGIGSSIGAFRAIGQTSKDGIEYTIEKFAFMAATNGIPPLHDSEDFASISSMSATDFSSVISLLQEKGFTTENLSPTEISNLLGLLGKSGMDVNSNDNQTVYDGGYSHLSFSEKLSTRLQSAYAIDQATAEKYAAVLDGLKTYTECTEGSLVTVNSTCSSITEAEVEAGRSLAQAKSSYELAKNIATASILLDVGDITDATKVVGHIAANAVSYYAAKKGMSALAREAAEELTEKNIRDLSIDEMQKILERVAKNEIDLKETVLTVITDISDNDAINLANYINEYLYKEQIRYYNEVTEKIVENSPNISADDFANQLEEELGLDANEGLPGGMIDPVEERDNLGNVAYSCQIASQDKNFINSKVYANILTDLCTRIKNLLGETTQNEPVTFGREALGGNSVISRNSFSFDPKTGRLTHLQTSSTVIIVNEIPIHPGDVITLAPDAKVTIVGAPSISSGQDLMAAATNGLPDPMYLSRQTDMFISRKDIALSTATGHHGASNYDRAVALRFKHDGEHYYSAIVGVVDGPSSGGGNAATIGQTVTEGFSEYAQNNPHATDQQLRDALDKLIRTDGRHEDATAAFFISRPSDTPGKVKLTFAGVANSQGFIITPNGQILAIGGVSNNARGMVMQSGELVDITDLQRIRATLQEGGYPPNEILAILNDISRGNIPVHYSNIGYCPTIVRTIDVPNGSIIVTTTDGSTEDDIVKDVYQSLQEAAEKQKQGKRDTAFQELVDRLRSLHTQNSPTKDDRTFVAQVLPPEGLGTVHTVPVVTDFNGVQLTAYGSGSKLKLPIGLQLLDESGRPVKILEENMEITYTPDKLFESEGQFYYYFFDRSSGQKVVIPLPTRFAQIYNPVSSSLNNFSLSTSTYAAENQKVYDNTTFDTYLPLVYGLTYEDTLIITGNGNGGYVLSDYSENSLITLEMQTPDETTDAYLANNKYLLKPGLNEIQIGITKGGGKVTYKTETGYAHAINKPGDSTTVIFTFFEDTNKNGVKDEGEIAISYPNAKIMATADSLASRTYALETGWNLISVPLNITGLTASELLKEISLQGGYATTISTYKDGRWISYKVRGEQIYSDEDFEIKPGESYMVKMLNSTVLTLAGLPLTAQPEIEFNVGWNLVGFAPMQQESSSDESKVAWTHTDQDGTWTAQEILKILQEEGYDATMISQWENSKYNTLILENNETYGLDYNISQVEGYFVLIKKKPDKKFKL